MQRSLSIGALALCVASSVAVAQVQQFVIPQAMANVGGAGPTNVFPYGYVGTAWPGLRILYNYDSSHFTNANINYPILITGVRWRANDSTSTWSGGTHAQGTLELSTAAVPVTAPDTNWPNNHGPDRTVVHSGPITVIPGTGNGVGVPGPYFVDIQFPTNPFLYDPGSGNGLIIDSDTPLNGWGGGTSTAHDVADTATAMASRVYGSSMYPAANGVTLDHAVIIEIDYVPAGSNYASKVNYGQGCYDSDTASFYELFNVSPIDLAAGTSLSATPTGNGYVVLPGGNQWYTPTSTPVTIGDDQVLPFPLGWTLPFPNGSTTDLWVSSNGFVNLTSTTNNGCCAGSNTGLLGGGARWAALWNDLNPGAGGSVYFDTDPVTGTAYVTFDQVPRYGTQDLNTFQYCFNSTGSVELRYGACAIQTGTTLIGWSPGIGNVDPGPIDITATPVILTAQQFPLTLDGDARPIIGTTVNMTIDSIPAGSPIAALIYGLTKHDPGIDLTAFGMPGCFQYCSQDSVLLILAPGASAASPFTIPNDPGLAGVEVKAQGAAYSPGVIPNSVGASTTNGVQLNLDVN